MFDFDSVIRKVKDFPKPGILFYDITGLLSSAEAFNNAIDEMVKLYSNRDLDAIYGIEARGFIFGPPLALRLGLPFIPVRKKGKLPGETVSRSFLLEYGEDIIEIHKADIKKGSKVLVVDDLIATGGTVKATCDLLSENGAKVEDVFCFIGLPFLNYKKVLGQYSVTTLIDYDSE